MAQTRSVHVRALPAFQQVTANLAAEQAKGNYYAARHIGTFVWRRIGGSYRMSTHSFGSNDRHQLRHEPVFRRQPD